MLHKNRKLCVSRLLTILFVLLSTLQWSDVIPPYNNNRAGCRSDEIRNWHRRNYFVTETNSPSSCHKQYIYWHLWGEFVSHQGRTWQTLALLSTVFLLVKDLVSKLGVTMAEFSSRFVCFGQLPKCAWLLHRNKKCERAHGVPELARTTISNFLRRFCFRLANQFSLSQIWELKAFSTSNLYVLYLKSSFSAECKISSSLPSLLW